MKILYSAEYSIFINYEGTDFRQICKRVLQEAEFSLSWDNIELDLDCIEDAFATEVLKKRSCNEKAISLDLLESTFYRSKALLL